MARVLVIEDDSDLAEVLGYNLRRAGHVVWVASTGKVGLQMARQEHPDVVLLDLMLPDVPGTDICKQLKSDAATCTTSVIVVSATGEETDRVAGFELGADDYVVKPFSVRELLLRIQAVMRRAAKPASSR
jgi:two-component system, OmpR family, phosphate regulon response regulator PhoB